MKKYLALIISVSIFIGCFYSLYNKPHEMTADLVLCVVGMAFSVVLGIISLFDIQGNDGSSFH